MDDPNNEFLFGDKFEERLSKESSARQKSKFLFTGLNKKPAV